MSLGASPRADFHENWKAPAGYYIAGFYGAANPSSMTRLAPLYRKIPLLPGTSEEFRYGSLAYKNVALINQATNKAVEITGDNNSGMNLGTNIQQWDANYYSGQIWQLRPAENGAYYLVNSRNGYVLDAVAGVPGKAVVQFSYHGGDIQKWYLDPVNGGYMLRNKATGLVLDVPQYNGNNGVGLGTWTAKLWKKSNI